MRGDDVFNGGTVFGFLHTQGIDQDALIRDRRSHTFELGQRTAGWLDLTMPASLYGAQNGQRLLRFDGSTYQPLPSPGQPSPGQPAPAEATAQPVGPPLLEMGAVPFEQIGRTLPCAAALP